MENASKALLIAGGILVSLIVISMFVYSFSHISNFVAKTSEDPYEQEVLDFNSGFQAYDKKLMYGIDLISVLNQAINNNKRYGVEYYNEPDEEENLDYYVNVIIKYEYDVRNNTGRVTQHVRVEDSLKYDYARGENIIKTKYIDTILNNEGTIEGFDNLSNFKGSGFRCTKISYNQKNEVKALGAVRQS